MPDFIKTKIIATLGPASANEEKIRELIKSGVRVFRVNSSHDTKDFHKGNIETVREISSELNIFVAILLDLQGPKIRVGTLINSISIEPGQKLVLKPAKEQTGDDFIPVDYEGILEDVSVGNKLLLDDGKIELEVLEVNPESLITRVVRGSVLKSRKGLNFPGASGSLSALTERDKDYVKFAVDNKIDYIALSFVRNKEDVIETKKEIEKYEEYIPVIAKIEKPQAVTNLSEIAQVADGLMVARGDLGIEISPEQVPIVQKKIINTANMYRIPVITATQMLESMIESPIPTRAEASDIANAIIDGTDAVMLSGETAMGEYPVEAVQMMAKIAKNVEENNYCNCNIVPKKCGEYYEADSQAIVSAVIKMLDEIEVSAIVALTKSGYTASLLSKTKPIVPIIAITDCDVMCRRQAMMWGVLPYGINMEFEENFTETTLKRIDECLLRDTFLNVGDKVIITGGLPCWLGGRTNFLRLYQLGSAGIIS